ncbi:hypothetical protein AAVH_25433 [Aphelenchoides avenae]|nr:hypothetical protein AAVH_25433 [Aphelenchus avenae]
MISATTKLIVVLAVIKRSATEGELPTTKKPAATVQCVSCASEVLLAEWTVTGFPVQPSVSKEFVYSTNCMRVSPDIPSAGCNTLCVEALYAIKGTLAVLRGCLGTFLGEASTAGANPGCTYGSSATPVNVFDESDGTKTLKAIQCASCQEYDGIGEKCRQDVSEKRRCNGNWCTKIEGRIAGHWTEIRGCAPFNPLVSESKRLARVRVITVRLDCVKIKREEVSALVGIDIKQEYDLTQCFCNSESRCNGAHRLENAGAAGLLVLVMATIAAVYKYW